MQAVYATSKGHGRQNGEKWKAFPLKSETSKTCACSPLLDIRAHEKALRAIRQGKEIQSEGLNETQ